MPPGARRVPTEPFEPRPIPWNIADCLGEAAGGSGISGVKGPDDGPESERRQLCPLRLPTPYICQLRLPTPSANSVVDWP